MKRVISFVYIVCCAVVLAPARVLSDVDIGSGFSCSGTSIFKGTQEITYKKARSNTKQTLEKLKSKIQKAPKSKKAAIKEQINAIKNAKTQLKACSNGELDPGETETIFQQLSSGSGTFNGNYNGTVDGFIPLSGEITFQFTLEGTEFSALLTLGGNLGSALNAEPLAFSADVGGIAFPATFTLPDTFLGVVTLQINENGDLLITNEAEDSSIDFDGNFSENTINGNLNGSYDGHSFTGTFALDRE